MRQSFTDRLQNAVLRKTEWFMGAVFLISVQSLDGKSYGYAIMAAISLIWLCVFANASGVKGDSDDYAR